MSSTSARDKCVLGASWIACACAALAAWAFAAEPKWAGTPGIGVVAGACSGLLLLLPLSLILIRLIDPSASLTGRIARVLQRRECLALLLLGHALIQLSYLTGGKAFNDFLLPLTTMLVALMFAWVFVGRSPVGPDEILPPALWLSALTCARIGYQHAVGTISPLEATWRGATLYGFFAAALAALALVPLAMLSGRLASSALAWLRRAAVYARVPLVLALAAVVLLLGVSQIRPASGVRLDLALRASILAVLALLAWVSLCPAEGAQAQTHGAIRPTPRDIPATRFWVAAAVLCIAYIALSSLVTAPGQINPDGLAYLTIARSISEGNFIVRGYWSPLMSWLLAPAIAMGMDPYGAFQVFVRVCGLVWIVLGVALSRRAGVGRIGQLVLGIVLALIALTRTFYPVTPDILGAVLLSCYFLHTSRPSFTTHPMVDGALAGLLGAAAAYAKYYNAPFFIAHVLVWSLILWTRRKRDASVLKTLAVALVTFFLITAPYAVAMANRYGSPTFTTSSRINRAAYGPSALGQFPCWATQLCPEPDDVLFPWEDPLPEYYPDLGWSPFQSLDNLRFQIRLAWWNITQWISEALVEVGPMPSLALGVLLVAVASTWRNGWSDPLPLMGLLTVVLHASGYFLITAESFRFFLATLPILWIVYFKLLSSRRFVESLSPSRAEAALVIQLLLLAIPILSFSWFAPLRSSFDSDDVTCIQQDSLHLGGLLEAPFVGTDAMANHVAYYTGLRTIGVLPTGTVVSEADVLLRSLDVQTILAGSDLALTPGLAAIPGYQIIGESSICNKRYTVLRVPR